MSVHIWLAEYEKVPFFVIPLKMSNCCLLFLGSILMTKPQKQSLEQIKNLR